MSRQLDNTSIRCIFCNSSSIDIYATKSLCHDCGHEFSDFEGIKFLGSYSSNDFLGLLEITSKVFSTPNPANTRKHIEATEDKLIQEFKKTYSRRWKSIFKKKNASWQQRNGPVCSFT